jgi:hypothetical protein
MQPLRDNFQNSVLIQADLETASLMPQLVGVKQASMFVVRHAIL